MDAYEDLIDIKDDDRNKLNRSMIPFFFIKPNESYSFNYTPIKLSETEASTPFPKFPFPNDFSSYESYSEAAKNWMEKALSIFLQYSKAPLLPVPTTLFYRTFRLDFWPNDKDTLRTLAKKFGPYLLPLRPKNLLELQDKILYSPTNITDPKYNSNEEEIFKNEKNFSEPDYNGRPLPYKYHFTQNNFFQLIPPEPVPDYFDTFEQYSAALKNWHRIVNQKYPGYKKIIKVEELGEELGIKPEVSTPSNSTYFSSRRKIDKMNNENRQKLFNKNSKTCTNDQLSQAFDVKLTNTEFDRLASINIQKFESSFNLFSKKETESQSKQNDSMTKIRDFCFSEDSFNSLNENKYEEISFTIDELIEFGPDNYVSKFPIKNYDVMSRIVFVDPNQNMGEHVQSNQNYSKFPLFLLNNESPDQFIQKCEEQQIDFLSLIKTSDEFANFINLCDPKDMILSQKFVYVFQNLFSSPTKFDTYVKPLIGQFDKNDCYSFDMKCHQLLKKFMKIIEGAGEFDDFKVSQIMYKSSINIDESAYINQKNKSPNQREFNRKEVLNIYKLCARCSLLYTFTQLFSFQKWNSSIIFEYISGTILNPLLIQLSKKIQTFKKDIIACYINDIISKLDKNIKKANKNKKNLSENQNDIGSKLASFSSDFSTFSEASKCLSDQFVIPTRKSQLRIPIFVFNQDGNPSKKVNTIDDDKINDNTDKTLTDLSSSNKAANSAQPSKPLNNRPSLIDDEAIDSNFSPLIPQSVFNCDDEFNFDNIIENIESGNAEYPSHFIVGGQGTEEVENTINSLHHSISAMSNSFKTLPKVDDTLTNNKKVNYLAYKIIFMIINIDYPNLHNALFYPSPINFFSEISKLENDNSFMNLAAGFCNKTEKLKSLFLYSDAFKNMKGSMIKFDVNKLDLSNISFTQRALLVLNSYPDRLFSRAQITSLLKTFTSKVSRFNFALCPTIALHFKNREKFLYKTNIVSESKIESSRNSGRFSLGGSSLNSSVDLSASSIDTTRKQARKPPIGLKDDQNDAEISSMPYSIPPLTSSSSFKSGFRFKKEKSTRSIHKKSLTNDGLSSINQNEINIDQFDAKSRNNDIENSNSNPISSSPNSTSFQRRDQVQIYRQKRLSNRKNTDSIFGICGNRMSFRPSRSYADCAAAFNSFSSSSSIGSNGVNSVNFGSAGNSNSSNNMPISSANSDGSLLARDDENKNNKMLTMKPQYAGKEWINDATMIAAYLASLVYSVNSSCFPYLLRSINLLFCSSKINFPNKFWGTFCGALSVAEINAWIFLRTIFKLGFTQIFTSEFPLFFPAVFNYKSPYVNKINNNNNNNNNGKKTSGSLISPPTDSICLNFENLNKQIEKAKQLSLKIVMLAAVISSSAEVSLQFLEAIFMTDRNHLYKIFSKSVNPSIKIEKLNSINMKKAVNVGSETKSSININFYSSSYKASLSNIIKKNLSNFRKIVEKLKTYGNKFQNLISIFPVS